MQNNRLFTLIQNVHPRQILRWAAVLSIISTKKRAASFETALSGCPVGFFAEAQLLRRLRTRGSDPTGQLWIKWKSRLESWSALWRRCWRLDAGDWHAEHIIFQNWLTLNKLEHAPCLTPPQEKGLSTLESLSYWLSPVYKLQVCQTNRA